MKEMEGDEEEETAGYLSGPFCTTVQPVLFTVLRPAAKGAGSIFFGVGDASTRIISLKALPPIRGGNIGAKMAKMGHIPNFPQNHLINLSKISLSSRR